MPQPFEIDNTKRLYLLEADDNYDTTSFEITHYFEITETIKPLTSNDEIREQNYFKILPEYENDNSKTRVKGDFKAKIVEKKVFAISYNDDKSILNIKPVTDYKKKYTSETSKRVFLVHEGPSGNYLYSNDDNSEKEFTIGTDIISIEKCIKQPFDNFLPGNIADTNFLERVKKVEDYLSPLKDTIRSLYQSVALENITKIEGGRGDHAEQAEYLKVDEEKNTHFHNMIDLYIRCVNEILNVPLFKKIFYLSHLINEEDVTKTIGNSSLELIKQFNYVGFFIQSLLNKEKVTETTIPDVLGNLLTGVETKKLLSSSELFQDRFKGINHIETDNAKSYGLEEEFFKDDNVYKEDYIINKYNLEGEQKTNIRIYNVTYFVNNILLPIKNANIKYHELFDKDPGKDNDNKKMLGKFFYFILEIIENEMKAIQLLIYTRNTFDNVKGQRKQSDLIKNLKLDNIQKEINKLIGQQIDTNILTYLKIRNDQHNQDEINKSNYNARFQIKIEDTPGAALKKRVMELNYSDDNKKYYEKNDAGEIKPIENDDLYNIKKNVQYSTSYINPNERTNYPRKYIFGEFNNIFTPEKNNKEIADEAKEITKNLMEGRPVFIIGYGASGAGKTSSLIYFNKKEENGILVEICNIMGKQGYTKASIKSCEIYRDASAADKRTNITKNPETFNGEGISFSYKDNGFTLDTQKTYQNHHVFRAHKQQQRKEEKEKKDKSLTIKTCAEPIETTFAQGERLGKYLIHIIDTDRHVKATTNNANSSRSHSLVFVKLSRGDKKDAHLIVGDFAGVENEFNCEDSSVLNDFMKIEADDGSGLFYKNEVCDEKLDPIGNTAKKEKEKLMNAGGNYNFGEALQDQPFSYSNLGQLSQLKDTIKKQTILQQYFGKEFDNINKFKTAVRLIRRIADIRLKKDSSEEKNLIKPEDVDTFKTYSELNKPKDNVWKKAKDGWTLYKDSVKEIKTMIENNQKNNVDTILKEQLNSLIDDTIKLTEGLSSNVSTIPMLRNQTNTAVSREIIKKFDFQGIFESKKYKDNLFLFFAKVIEKKGTDELKDKLDEKDEKNENKYEGNYANKAIQFLTDNNTNNNTNNRLDIDKFFTLLQEQESGYTYFKREWFPEHNTRKNTILVKEIVPGFMKTFKQILEEKYPQTKSEFDLKLDNYHHDNIHQKFFVPEETYIKVYQQLTSHTVDGKPIFNVWTLDEIKNNLNKSQYEKDMQLIDDILGNETELGPIGIYLIELELYTYGKLALATEVCSNRKEEGYLINNSLEGVRDMIRKILQAKNQAAIQLVPNYINICFDRYCPTHTNCFSFDTRNTKQETNQDKVIIGETITDYLNSNNKKINDLVVGIFCVFNISQMTSNPPPVPYVDINDLKRIVFNYNLFDEKYQKSKEGKKRITSFVLCAKELLNTIDNKFIDRFPVGDSFEEKNLLGSLKNEPNIDAFKNLPGENIVLKDSKGVLISRNGETYNLYNIFKFLLNQLVNTREVVENAKTYADKMSSKLQTDNAQKSVLAEMMENKAKRENESVEGFESEIINKINKQDREINVNQVHKNDFTKIYQLNDLTKLVQFLNYDLKRLEVADQSVGDYDKDGYNGIVFFNYFEGDHKDEFNSEYPLSKEIIETNQSWEKCSEIEKERVYGDLRQYIEKTIVSLYKTIFRGENEEKIIAQLIEFDVNMFKNEINNDLEKIRKKKRGDMNNYLNNIQEEEKERLADEARKEEPQKIEPQKIEPQAKAGKPVRASLNLNEIKKGISSQQKRSKYKKGGGQLTVTNISAIINYIGKRVHYMRSDAFDEKKIEELRNMLTTYKHAIESLDNFIIHLNETIKDYKTRIILLSKDKNSLIKSVNEIEKEKQEIEEDEDKYNKLKEKYIGEYHKIEETVKNSQKDAIKAAVFARGNNKQQYYNTQNKINGVPLSKLFMYYLEDFLTSIDNLNAASAVGTLEFLDKMAKLNTVSTICNFNNSEIDENKLEDKLEKDGYKLKNLYEEITQ